MAKKKETLLEKLVAENQTNFGVAPITIGDITINVDEVIDKDPEVIKSVLNGKGVGVYYDETLKKYVLATLSLCPENDSAIIINKKVLKSSKIGALMETEVALKQLLQKELK